jgi:hypothetical protein
MIEFLVSAARKTNSRVIAAETHLRPQAFLVAAHPTKRPQSIPPRSVDRGATSPCSNRFVNRLPPPPLRTTCMAAASGFGAVFVLDSPSVALKLSLSMNDVDMTFIICTFLKRHI